MSKANATFQTQRQDSTRRPSNNQNRERHITPSDLENLIISIKERPELEPLRHSPPPSSPPRTQPCPIADIPLPPSSPRPVDTDSSTSTVATVATANTDGFNSPDAASDTSVASSEGSSHCVVRGFTPGSGVTSYHSKTQLAPVEPRPILKTSGNNTPACPTHRKGMFMLGCSSGEEDLSLSGHISPRLNPTSSADSQANGHIKKQTSFKDEVLVMRDSRSRCHKSSAVVDSDDDSDDCDSDIEEVSESAIDDDDDAWEDDTEEPNPEEKEIKFCRVDSKANLVSRKSALTLNLEGQRSGTKLQNSRSTPALQLQRARTSPMNGPSMPASPEDESVLEMKRGQMSTSKPLVMANSKTDTSVAPLPSPCTLRRNMFCGELSESLRKNMLTERLQKNPLGASGAQMKRAHTSFDVSKLAHSSQPAEQAAPKDLPTVAQQTRKPSWNHYFDHSVGEYHQAGW